MIAEPDSTAAPIRGVQELLDALPDGHVMVDEGGAIVMANQRLAQLVGYTAGEMLDLELDDLIPPDHRAAHPEVAAEYLRRPVVRSIGVGRDVAIRHRDGSEIPVDICLSPLTLEGRRYVLAAVRDARERITTEQAGRNSALLARELFLKNAAGAFRVTLGGEILECNDALAEMLGYDSPETLQRLPADSFYMVPSSRESWLARLSATGAAMNYEFQMRRKDGTPLWVLENSILVDDPSTNGPVVMGTVIDLSKHKEQEARLEELAHHDFLTGLPNRRLMQERAGHVFAVASRRGGKAALICCDLRRFKQINDACGHKTGDEVLSQVAERLVANSRAEDTVVRLGGDEFAVLLPDVKDEGDALSSARRLAAFLDEPFQVDGQSFQLDASFGLAIYPDDGKTIDELLACADHAMYSTSRWGRKEIQVYSEVATEGRTQMLAREERFRQALDHNELVLFYQPIVCLETGTVAGAEALIRWDHPGRGLLPASEFIELAEYTGLIAALDQWVLEALTREIGRSSMPANPEWVSLNVSPSSIAHPEFVSRVNGALEAGTVDGSRLVLEITERMAMRDPKSVGSLLHTLREAGVRIAIDDFGVGHSALSLLKELPVQYLKVDGSFMPDVMRDERSKALVLGIIGLAHGLGLQVIAEGVETQEQYEWLANVGCDYAQGWWTGRPSPAAELFSTSEGSTCTVSVNRDPGVVTSL